MNCVSSVLTAQALLSSLLKRTECNFGSYEISAAHPPHDRPRARLRQQVAAATIPRAAPVAAAPRLLQQAAARRTARVGRAATTCARWSRGNCLWLQEHYWLPRARPPATACARRQAIANVNETATQMPRDRLEACAYCRRLFGCALQNELRVICLTAQTLLRPCTERNLAVMKFPLHDCRATAPRVAPASVAAR
jgi:hypothetical protein